MKRLTLFLFIFYHCFVSAQINETFIDGNFDSNPAWAGNNSSFLINSSFELQSCATATSVSYLSTPSNSFNNATWECTIKINYSTSSSNYACFYIAADNNQITNECNAYYVQAGGTNDEISMFIIQNGKKTKLIDGIDKRTDGNPLIIKIKVTRDNKGNFTLMSKINNETEFTTEGTVFNNLITKSEYIAVLYSNTTTTGNDYIFDDIFVSGEKAPDYLPPQILNLAIKATNQLELNFNEPVSTAKADFVVDNNLGIPYKIEISENKKRITLFFNEDFAKGIVYELIINGLTDTEGNFLIDNKRKIGLTEKPCIGEVEINEIMFNAPEISAEYIELINLTGKVLDLSGMKISSRKNTGAINSGEAIPQGVFISPNGYLALTPYPELVREYHLCPLESDLSVMPSWSALNNESADILLTDENNDSIFDEVIYSVNWQNNAIKNPQGVALERVHPQLESNDKNSWHSAASEVNYGTPGYKNSQYRDIYTETITDQPVWIDPVAFSPDNDGVADQCIIHYKTPESDCTGTAIIYNASGQVIKSLFADFLLSTEGIMIWDGTDKKNTTVQNGIYILYFELINAKSSEIKRYKIPFVVSCR